LIRRLALGADLLRTSIQWGRNARSSHRLRGCDQPRHLHPEEIESGLARLINAGFLFEAEGRFVPYGEPLSWFDEFENARVTSVGSIDWVAKRLGAGSYRAGRDRRNSLRHSGFARAAFDLACRTYSDRVAAILRQVTIKKGAVTRTLQ